MFHPDQFRIRWRHKRSLCVSAALLAVAGCGPTLLTRFEHVLGAQDSATAALEQWCASRGIAEPARIVARPLTDQVATEPTGLRQALDISDREEVRFRHVQLSCGDKVLSVATNWYVPGRLTPAMNATLDNSATPFGRVAAPLGFRRERLDTRRGALPGCPSAAVLSHRARLILPDGKPLALVTECYTAENLRDDT